MIQYLGPNIHSKAELEIMIKDRDKLIADLVSKNKSLEMISAGYRKELQRLIEQLKDNIYEDDRSISNHKE